MGDGSIVLEAVKRLLSYYRKLGRTTVEDLQKHIVGFEFHSETASGCQRRLMELLCSHGLSSSESERLAHEWVVTGDFLLQTPGKVTHVVANPPYLRWSKIPQSLSRQYRECIPQMAARGDIALAFMERMLCWLRPTGSLVALINDRWMYNQYGHEFLLYCIDEGWKIAVLDARPEQPFVRNVGAYAAIIRVGKQLGNEHPPNERATAAALHISLLTKYGSLETAGCKIQVGPALGAGKTFLISAGEAEKIEPDLVRSYVSREDLNTDSITNANKLVVVPYDLMGRLIAIEDYDLFREWAAQHEVALKARSIVSNGTDWWRTIDGVGTQWHGTRKLLIPELSRQPKAVLDETASIPSHSIYALWSKEWPLEALQRVLNGGLLTLTAKAKAPMLSGGWFRLYKRFLVQTPLPRWQGLSEENQQRLLSESKKCQARAFEQIFNLPYEL
ncbi:hypothetical protein ELH39_01055 [Rhizobium ruizarguesonis]|uniref:Eco57I restriction-modification methylase domain-containing protein n=1 Tax=Rhizobium ruizarguesonis TaxID=2081791 RepID=UPI001030FD6D|nr:hypothetical protein [Rhizobium ruizarguesonis]TBB95938.1 hypothetical protein ELH39_01055 [Rhizobium ruizarguesonis]